MAVDLTAANTTDDGDKGDVQPFRTALADIVRSTARDFERHAFPLAREEWRAFSCLLSRSSPFKSAYKQIEAVVSDVPVLERHFKNIVLPTTGSGLQLEATVHSFILEVLRRSGAWNSCEKAFAEVFGSFERFLFANDVRLRFTAALVGFEADAERIDLTDGASILTLPQVDAMKRLDGLWGLDDSTHLCCGVCATIRSFIQLERAFPKNFARPPDPAHTGQQERDTTTLIVDGLRVLGPGDVACPLIHVESAEWCPFLRNITLTSSPWVLPMTPGFERYRFSEVDSAALIRTIKGIKELSRDSPLSLCVHWFSRAMADDEPVDKLIALMIAAEAFFLNDGKLELRYKFAQRLAVYLGKTADDRRERLKFAKDAYDLRSNVVHGGAFDHAAVVMVGRELERIMREALQKALSTPVQDRPTNKPQLWDDIILALN